MNHTDKDNTTHRYANTHIRCANSTSKSPARSIWKATVKERVLPLRQWPRLLRGE